MPALFFLQNVLSTCYTAFTHLSPFVSSIPFNAIYAIIEEREEMLQQHTFAEKNMICTMGSEVMGVQNRILHIDIPLYVHALLKYLQSAKQIVGISRVAYLVSGNTIFIRTYFNGPNREISDKIYELEMELMDHFRDTLRFDFVLVFDPEETNPSGFSAEYF